MSYRVYFLSLILFLSNGCASDSDGRPAPNNRKDSRAREADITYFKSLGATFVNVNTNGVLIGIDSTGRFTDDAMSRLVSHQDLSYLSLLDSSVTDDGISYLKRMKSLRRLVLNRSRISDLSLEHISELPNLEELDLGWTKVTDNSVEQLEMLQKLVYLNIENTKISTHGLLRLRNKLPKTTIRH